MTSRAVVLPTPGDPLLLSYWLRNYAEWKHTVDQLYVMITWPQEYEVLRRCYDDVHAAGGAIILPPVGADRVDHGTALDMMLPGVEEQIVVLMEDDLYVRKPEEIDKCFKLIEEGFVQAVGCSRGSSSMEIINHSQMRGYPHGAALWPHLLFARTEDLTSLKESFAPRSWRAGEEVRGLDYWCQEDCTSDTAVAATIELRSRVEIAEISSDDGDSGDPPWFHVGSLSTGPLGMYAIESAYEQRENWARRTAWWTRVLGQWPGGLSDYCKAYRSALNELTTITLPFLPDRVKRYDQLVNW